MQKKSQQISDYRQFPIELFLCLTFYPYKAKLYTAKLYTV